MAITTDAYTAADLAPVIQEVWADILQEPRFAKGTLINWATDLSEFMDEGADIAHVPGIYTNQFTVSSQSTQGAEIDTQAVAATDTTLTVDTHKYVAFLIGDKDMVQMASKYNLNEAYVREARELLMKDLEEALFSLYSDISSYSVNTGTPGVMTDDHVREAIESQESNENIEASEDSALFVHPFVFWRQLGAIAKYYETDKSNFDFLRTGNFGDMKAKGGLYSVPVFTSPRVQVATDVYKNILCTRKAFGFAVQTQYTPNGSGRFRSMVTYEHRNFGTLASVDVIYGVTTLRESDAVLINASNAAA